MGETPLPFDRGFSPQRWLDALSQSGCSWVAGLNKGGGAKSTEEEGEEVPLFVEKGEKREVEGVYYRGRTKVNVAGVWREGFKEPLWVMGDLPPERLVEVYSERMKIEQSFKDAKSLLDIDKAVNKKLSQLEATLALALMAYALGLSGIDGGRGGEGRGVPPERAKRGLYSGLFVLLKKRLPFTRRRWRGILGRVLASWRRGLFPPLPGGVRSHG
ncbi:MAG: transposase [Rubrobacter sp.]|nr:transposase [Rubrobacter sp.]